MEQQEILLDLPQENVKKTAQFSYADFLKQQENCKDPEEKIRACIVFMQQCLSREGPPSFKDFWEARKLCLLLFKEALNPKLRSELWESYIGLTTEAYHLKEMLDTESSFAREQIESAIQDLEQSLSNFPSLLKQVSSIEIPEACEKSLANRTSYNEWNQELHLLHSFAERIHSLRKEILKTQMRFRFKNKLLDKLMKLGDQVFPRRKDLTLQLSTGFLADIEAYIAGPFEREASTHELKDTIKAFQFVAKQLYLSSDVVVKAKEQLSSCWEKIQVKDKERKTEISQKKTVYRANYDRLAIKLQDLDASFSAGNLQESELDAAYEELQQEMEKTELGREEVRALKQAYQQLKNRFSERHNRELQEKKKLQLELENQRQKNFQHLKVEIEKLLEDSPEFDAIQKKTQFFEEEKKKLQLNDSEEIVLASLLKQLKFATFDKWQETLFSQFDGQPEFAEKLQELLDERKKMRQELKKELEQIRKLSGGSGLDFEKAMFYRDFIDAGKQQLDQMESSIIEIEEKLFDL